MNLKLGKKYLKDKIYDMMVNDFFTGGYKVSDYITEQEICNKYEASRTPVREAMIRLVHEGILKQIPKGGYLVKLVTYKHLLDIMDIRILLEKYATELAIDRITQAELSKMKTYTIYPVKIDIFEFNKAFHMIIAEASGNQKLVESIEEVLYETRKAYLLDPILEQHIGSENEHTEIYRAFLSRDREKAIRLVEEHIVNSKMRLQKRLYNNTILENGSPLKR